eukprot:jgi/Hompol1/3831/HPOL_006768-RA
MTALCVSEPPPDVVSSLKGKKQALLIGIVYRGTPHHLEGCINDAMNMRQFLIEHFGFDPANIRVMTEDATDPSLIPTRENILASMEWLIRDSQSGDSLFLQYSGHGTQQRDLDGDEDSAYDEAICPLDFETAGTIIDDKLNAVLVHPLQRGVRLTAVFAFTYYHDGRMEHQYSNGRRKSRVFVKQNIVVGAIKDAISKIANMGISQASTPVHHMTEEERIALKGNKVAD